MLRPRELFRKLLHIEDTPERTALAFSIGVFLGYSPFLGLHTLGAIGLAFLLKLNRVAMLLGAWTNAPWWIVPYYTFATWIGMWVMRVQIDGTVLKEIFRAGKDQGFTGSDFWTRIASQWGFLASFIVGSSILAALFSLAAYPLSLKLIRMYRSRIK
jgi:uncharacterized protein (DUF2062 family)